MAFNRTVISDWGDIHVLAKHGWLYRGQRSADWPLQTSLERCCNRQKILALDQSRIESELFREFRRAYHQYANHIPDASSCLEWMSLMQHHGAPTRLLDFTYSIYVAAYFALESAEGDAAVWAFNGPWALGESIERFHSAAKPNWERLREPFREEHERFLIPIFFRRTICPSCLSAESVSAERTTSSSERRVPCSRRRHSFVR